MRRSTHPRGFTLIELLIVVAIAAILLTVAVPSFTGTAAKARLEGALVALGVDVQYARSQAIRVQRAVTLQVDNVGSSYTISDSTGVLKSVTMPAGVTLTPSVAVSFDALRGMAAAVTVDGASSGTNATLRVSVNAMGRTQLCSPAASIPGYPSC